MVVESILLRHQLLILNRGRKRAPNLRPMDRAIAGVCALFMDPACGALCIVAILRVDSEVFYDITLDNTSR